MTKDKLPIKATFIQAASLPMRQYRAFIKVGAPLIIAGTILMVFSHFYSISEEESVGFLVVFILLWIIFILSLLMSIVGVHRIIILGYETIQDNKLLNWTGNELEYGTWWVLLGILIGIIYLPFLWLIFAIDEATVNQDTLFYSAIVYVIGIPAYYVMSRWSMVLPACAVGMHAKTPAWSWRISTGNGWRLTLLVGLPPITTEILLNLYPDSESLFFSLLSGATWLILGVIEIGLLSLSYSFLANSSGAE